jgi:hypothetical protein
MRRTVLTFAVLVALLTTGVPSWAHTRAPVASVPVPSAAPFVPSLETFTAAAPEPTLPWVALLLLGAVGVTAVSRQRRLMAVTLVAIVALLAFETGVHSTHHLGKPDDSAHCAVAWMSTQLSADLVDATVDAAPALAPQTPAPLLARPALAERAIAPDAGRAPPTLSA